MREYSDAHAQKINGVGRVADAALAFQFALKDLFRRSEDIIFLDLAGDPVVAPSVLSDAHVLSPSARIAPWVGSTKREKGFSTRRQCSAAGGGGTKWTLARPTVE